MRASENRIHVPEIEEPSWIPVIVLAFIPPLWWLTAIMVAKNLHKMWKNGKLKVFRRYALIIGDRPYVRLWELARATGKTKQEVRAELQEMIDQGYMGRRAYIDQSTDCVVIDPERCPDEAPAAEAAPQAKPQAVPQPVVREQAKPAEPVRPVERPTAAKPRAEAPKESEFEKTLREIRELNDRIADGPMSRQIDRIGEITASIFSVVQLKPERGEEVHKFMSYYLPTTMKLLESYSLLEKQSYQGENIVAARKDIEKIINTMVPAFEKQLDRLFQADALDISTDIEVLETMMAKDGLTEESGRLRMGAAGKR